MKELFEYKQKLKCTMYKLMIIFIHEPESFKTNILNQFLSTKLPFEFVFLRFVVKKLV